jgi:hypothetical protein
VQCASGTSHYDIAAEFHVSRYSVNRHWANHVTPSRKAELIAGPVQIAKLARRAADEDCSLIDYLAILRSELLRLFMDARQRGLIADAASVAQRLLNTLDAIGKLTGQLRAGGIVINNVASIGSTAPTIVLNDPSIVRMQATIIRALARHPDARADVIAALRGLEPKPNGHADVALLVPIEAAANA